MESQPVSLKTMRRWRQDKVGPTWHKLFHHVRYHEADVFDFEQQSAQHWQTILGDRERVPRIVTHPPKDSAAPAEQDAQTDPAVHYVSAKEIIAATGLPIYLFRDCAERERKRIPHLMLVGALQLVPDGEARAVLAEDCRLMAQDGLLQDEAEPFDVLMERCGIIEVEANRALPSQGPMQ
jgi:hypothetical protein